MFQKIYGCQNVKKWRWWRYDEMMFITTDGLRQIELISKWICWLIVSNMCRLDTQSHCIFADLCKSISNRYPAGNCWIKTSEKHLSMTFFLTSACGYMTYVLLHTLASKILSSVCALSLFGIFVNVIIVALMFSIKWFIFKFFLNTLTIMNPYHLYLVWASI